MRVGLAALGIGITLLAVGCREAPAGPTTTVVTTVVGGSGPTTPTPSPTPTPTPTYPTPTTPAAYLPLPTYGQSILTAWAGSPAGQTLLGTSCYLTHGALSSWGFIDGLVDQLRAIDTRWGYVCYRGSCSQPAQDAVAYYAGTNAPVPGATGIWNVTVITNYCTTNAQATWAPLYDATGTWTTRGRF